MTEQKKSAEELAREARSLSAQADTARQRETEQKNDPGFSQRLTDAIAEAENPDKRTAFAKEKHRNSPAFKAAKAHAQEALGEVRETIVQLRRADVELDREDRAELIAKVSWASPPAWPSGSVRRPPRCWTSRPAT